MSEYLCLYDILKEMIPSRLTTSFGYIGETEIDDNGNTVPVKNTVAFYFKGGFAGTRMVTTGQYFNEEVRLVLNIYGDSSLEGLKSILNDCDTIKRELDKCFNITKTYQDTGTKLSIICASRNMNINDLGRNEQGIPVLSINYLIKYNVGGI